MPFFKSRKNKNRRTDGTGFLTYADAYQLIKELIDEALEFYELEPAIVTRVLLNPSDFPRKSTPDGNGKMPDYSFLGTVRARFVESPDTQQIDHQSLSIQRSDPISYSAESCYTIRFRHREGKREC